MSPRSILLIAGAILTPSLFGGVIAVSDVTATSSWGSMPAVDIINGNGLDTSSIPPVHSSLPLNWYYWESQPFLCNPTCSVGLTFDLGSVYTVDSFRVWNFNYVNQAGPYTGRGVRNVSISTSVDGASYGSALPFEFAQAPGTDTYTGELFSGLGWTDTRYIKFDIGSYWGGGDSAGHVGLSEIQFYSDAVPEPSTALLLCAAALPLLLRKAKKG